MESIEVLEFKNLSQRDRSAWEGLTTATPSLASPFFRLEFAEAVAAARSDVMVLRWTRNGRPVGLLPLQRAWTGGVRPLGGCVSDWHGVVCESGDPLDVSQALTLTGLPRLPFTAAPVGNPLARHGRASTVSHLIDLSAGFAGYEQWRRTDRPKALRNLAARERKLNAAGSVEFRLDDPRPSTMAWLLREKAQQYRATGQPDVVGSIWVRRLFRQLVERRGPLLRPLVSSLNLNGEVIAAHLGITAGGVLHYWFPVYSAESQAFSPGLQLLNELARQSGALGLGMIDLGAGDYAFKHDFANATRIQSEGIAPSRTPQLFTDSTMLWAKSPRKSTTYAFPRRALRRVDRHLSLLEAAQL